MKIYISCTIALSLLFLSACASSTTQHSSVMHRGMPHLGVPLSVFIAAYGKPDAGSVAGDEYSFEHGALWVGVQSGTAVAIVAMNTANNGGDFADLQGAEAVCRPFLPSDALYVRTLNLRKPHHGDITAREDIYESHTEGEISAAYRYDERSIGDCVVQHGLSENIV